MYYNVSIIYAMFRVHPTRTYRWSHVSPVQRDAPTSFLPYPYHRFLQLHLRQGQVDYGEYGPYYSGVELEEWGVYTYARGTYGWSVDTTVKVWNFCMGEVFMLRGHHDWVNSVWLWDTREQASPQVGELMTRGSTL
ncbi:hypothetical protein M405DRAFT_923295 [Rhizopogon salebrosus TDB-379]|nr:hypothetical protein M405DRAFT_923295 [Rhizopogon salebrosus TDB-379]